MWFRRSRFAVVTNRGVDIFLFSPGCADSARRCRFRRRAKGRFVSRIIRRRGISSGWWKAARRGPSRSEAHVTHETGLISIISGRACLDSLCFVHFPLSPSLFPFPPARQRTSMEGHLADYQNCARGRRPPHVHEAGWTRHRATRKPDWVYTFDNYHLERGIGAGHRSQPWLSRTLPEVGFALFMGGYVSGRHLRCTTLTVFFALTTCRANFMVLAAHAKERAGPTAVNRPWTDGAQKKLHRPAHGRR